MASSKAAATYIVDDGRRNLMRSLPEHPGITGLMKSEIKRDLREIERLLAEQSLPGPKQNSATPGAKSPTSRVVVLSAPPAIPPHLTLAAKRRRWKKWEREPGALQRELATKRAANTKLRDAAKRAFDDDADKRQRYALFRAHLITLRALYKRRRVAAEALTKTLEAEVRAEVPKCKSTRAAVAELWDLLGGAGGADERWASIASVDRIQSLVAEDANDTRTFLARVEAFDAAERPGHALEDDSDDDDDDDDDLAFSADGFALSSSLFLKTGVTL